MSNIDDVFDVISCGDEIVFKNYGVTKRLRGLMFHRFCESRGCYKFEWVEYYSNGYVRDRNNYRFLDKDDFRIYLKNNSNVFDVSNFKVCDLDVNGNWNLEKCLLDL